jgi:hypothetical protein
MLSRRLTVAAVAVCALVTAWPANAKTSARTITQSYQGSSSIQGVISGSTDAQGSHYGYVDVPTSRKDHTVTVKVVDARGLPIAFQLSQGDRSDSATMTDIGEWCSSTPRAIRLPHPGQPVVVYVELGACGNSPSVPTTGTVSLTLR